MELLNFNSTGAGGNGKKPKVDLSLVSKGELFEKGKATFNRLLQAYKSMHEICTLALEHEEAMHLLVGPSFDKARVGFGKIRWASAPFAKEYERIMALKAKQAGKKPDGAQG